MWNDFYSLYDATVALDFKKEAKILLGDVVLTNQSYEQSLSRPIHKALAIHI